MRDFAYYREQQGEIGFAEQVLHSIVDVSGLPRVHPGEMVMFENGQVGQALFLNEDHVEVLILTGSGVRVGDQVARTGHPITIHLTNQLLGKTIDPLGFDFITKQEFQGEATGTAIDQVPNTIAQRKPIDTPFETGISIVDLAVPLGKGQRELIIGDRKTGKTQFVRQVLLSQAKQGSICIYAAIGKLKVDIKSTIEFFEKEGVSGQTVLVLSASDDPAGMVFLTPYTAMTIAEYFRSQGKDVLIIMDELTQHAKAYREVSLLAKRFPGRNAYPGDIFYAHSRLLERAGCFTSGAITCLAIAEAPLGDITGYIQTNIMSMTDGHIFFDSDAFNRGRRPPINPFLSVTRVGLQTQTPLLRELTRELSSFLVHLERLRQFVHFGAELSEAVRQQLALGELIYAFFDQDYHVIRRLPLSVVIFSGLWSGYWKGKDIEVFKAEVKQLKEKFDQDATFSQTITQMVASAKSFQELVNQIKDQAGLFAL